MFVILSYDVGEKRVKNIEKTVRKYLWQIHKSVYNGHLTEKQFAKLKSELQRQIVPQTDSIYIYKTENCGLFDIEQIGKPKETDCITL